MKKSIDQLEKELNANIEALSNKYVALILGENDVADEGIEKLKEDKRILERRLNALKKDLKFIHSMKDKSLKIDKKKERELEKQQNEIINWVKKMPNSISGIVKTIPKN